MIPTTIRPSTAVHLTALAPFKFYSNQNSTLFNHSWDMSSSFQEGKPVAKRKRAPNDDISDEARGMAIQGAYTDHDILQGRGKGVSKHRGNRRFRKIIKRYCNSYTQAKNNQERRRIVDLVLGEVHNRGRFLELHNSTWVVLTEKKIREKVSQVSISNKCSPNNR